MLLPTSPMCCLHAVIAAMASNSSRRSVRSSCNDTSVPSHLRLPSSFRLRARLRTKARTTDQKTLNGRFLRSISSRRGWTLSLRPWRSFKSGCRSSTSCRFCRYFIFFFASGISFGDGFRDLYSFYNLFPPLSFVPHMTPSTLCPSLLVDVFARSTIITS